MSSTSSATTKHKVEYNKRFRCPVRRNHKVQSAEHTHRHLRSLAYVGNRLVSYAAASAAAAVAAAAPCYARYIVHGAGYEYLIEYS